MNLAKVFVSTTTKIEKGNKIYMVSVFLWLFNGLHCKKKITFCYVFFFSPYSNKSPMILILYYCLTLTLYPYIC